MKSITITSNSIYNVFFQNNQREWHPYVLKVATFYLSVVFAFIIVSVHNGITTLLCCIALCLL